MGFDNAVKRVFSREGYWSDRPNDRGGLTIWGISTRSFPEHVKRLQVMSRDESLDYAVLVYRKEFWDKVRGDDLERYLGPDLAEQVFDFAVTSGPGTAVKTLQRVLNLFTSTGGWNGLAEDGGMGPKTLAVVETASRKNRTRYMVLLAKVYRWLRAEFYLNIVEHDPVQAENLEGWLMRI